MGHPGRALSRAVVVQALELQVPMMVRGPFIELRQIGLRPVDLPGPAEQRGGMASDEEIER